VVIAFSVGLLPSSFMAQTPAGLIPSQKLRAVPKSFGQIADCGPAELDPTFGGTGKVTTDFAGFDDSAYSVALQADGKIVVAGSSFPGPDFAVVRYNPDGSLDTSFGGTGKVTTNVISYDIATSVAIQTDGKIVVAGYTSGSNYDFALVRYNTDGSLDTSFGGTGKVATGFFTGSQDFVDSIAIQPDGKIITVGLVDKGSNNDFGLARYNTDGSLDTSFGGTGKVTTDFGGSADSASSVAIQADGRIIVAGSTSNLSSGDFALVRYNSDGSLDPSFGGTGKVTTDFMASDDSAASLRIQTDGKIVAAGSTANASDYDFALVRYNSDGSLDPSFGGTGKVATDFAASYDFASSIAIEADGKIVAAGYMNVPISDFALARYNSDGSLDTSFGGTGKISTDFGAHSEDQARSVAIQADGKIVAAGYSGRLSFHDFTLVRYGIPCGSPTPTPTPAAITVKVGTTPSGRSFSVDGTKYTSNQTFTWEAGSSHTIATTSPQSGGTGTQYVWTGWSDSGAISHVVAPTTNNAKFIANFQSQYYLTIVTSGNGQVRPASAWQNAGNVVTIQARANSGAQFSSWTGMGPGSFTGTSNPASVTMKGPITETATFSP